jgi:hypothetical protein
VRRIIAGVAASAFAVALLGGPSSAATPAVTIDAACRIGGHITFSPGVGQSPSAQTMTLSSGVVASDASTNCPLAQGADATLSGTVQAPSLQCDSSGQLTASAPATGKLTIRWPDSSTSTLSARWMPGSKAPQALAFSGRVKKGTYAGDAIKAHTAHIVLAGSCVHAQQTITQISFFASNDRGVEKLLTFSHS